MRLEHSITVLEKFYKVSFGTLPSVDFAPAQKIFDLANGKKYHGIPRYKNPEGIYLHQGIRFSSHKNSTPS